MRATPLSGQVAGRDSCGRAPGDVWCRKCGYNLRAADPGGRCPECGSPVAVSARPELLRFADPAWVATLATGVRFILWGTLVAALVTAAGLSAFGESLLGGLVTIAGGLVHFYGAWLLGRYRGREDEVPSDTMRLEMRLDMIERTLAQTTSALERLEAAHRITARMLTDDAIHARPAQLARPITPHSSSGVSTPSGRVDRVLPALRFGPVDRGCHIGVVELETRTCALEHRCAKLRRQHEPEVELCFPADALLVRHVTGGTHSHGVRARMHAFVQDG